jgi:hypothetical protein
MLCHFCPSSCPTQSDDTHSIVPSRKPPLTNVADVFEKQIRLDLSYRAFTPSITNFPSTWYLRSLSCTNAITFTQAYCFPPVIRSQRFETLRKLQTMAMSSGSAATVSDTRAAIDEALRARGGAFQEYSCREVSWDDVARGTAFGNLSVWGSNITDTYLRGKDGAALFTVRPNNWNEKLGVVAADEVALLVGNCDRPGDIGDRNGTQQLRNVTLQDFLRAPADTAARYAGITDSDNSLYDPDLDRKVSIRFQTVFLPVDATTRATTNDEKNDEGRQIFQFATEAYNYSAHSDEDPRNLILLATTQGLAVQADGRGAKKLLHHGYGPDNRIYEYWLEAERSDHKVGGQQHETDGERADALKRGKATSEILGIKAMGTRFNTLMTVQVPMKQARPPNNGMPWSSLFSLGPKSNHPPGSAVTSGAVYHPHGSAVTFGAVEGNSNLVYAPSNIFLCRSRAVQPEAAKRVVGTSNAARVSRGEIYGPHTALAVHRPVRNKGEHVTVTVVFYNMVAGGVPSKDDVIAAVSDMESLYDACNESGKLADAAFDFMKSELTVADMMNIAQKSATQPSGGTSKPVEEEGDR